MGHTVVNRGTEALRGMITINMCGRILAVQFKIKYFGKYCK